MKIKTSVSRKIFVFCNYLFLAVFALICLIPFWHVFMASISDPYDLLASKGVIWFASKPTIEGYKIIFADGSIFRGYLNTIIYAALSTVIGMAITAMGAYATYRKEFLLRNVFSVMVAITMLFSAGIIPSYMIVRNLGMYNTMWAVIIPSCFNVFNMIMLRASFQSLSESLVESAELDGAGHMTILFRIMLPLSKATLAVLVMYSVIGVWNSWFTASIYLRDHDLWPLQLVLKQMLIAHQTPTPTNAADFQHRSSMYNELVEYCSIVVAMLPIMVGFPFIQKYFTKGVMLGAVKG